MTKKTTLDRAEFHAAVHDELNRFNYHETQILSASQKKILQGSLDSHPLDLLMLLQDIGSGGEEETITFPRTPKGASAYFHRIKRIRTFLRTREQTAHITKRPLTELEKDLFHATAKIRTEITYTPPEPQEGIEQDSHLRIYSIDATDEAAVFRRALERRRQRHEEKTFGSVYNEQAPQEGQPPQASRLNAEDLVAQMLTQARSAAGGQPFGSRASAPQSAPQAEAAAQAPLPYPPAPPSQAELIAIASGRASAHTIENAAAYAASSGCEAPAATAQALDPEADDAHQRLDDAILARLAEVRATAPRDSD